MHIGHRGGRFYATENTLATFKKALEIGVAAVELEVRKSKDNQIIVFHDADVKRITSGEDTVADVTFWYRSKIFLQKVTKRFRQCRKCWIL